MIVSANEVKLADNAVLNVGIRLDQILSNLDFLADICS